MGAITLLLLVASLRNVALGYYECDWNTAYMNWTAGTVCDCEGAGGEVECFNDVQNHTDLVEAACSWKHLSLCAESEWQWSEWFDCPQCPCNTTDITWVTESDDWGTSCFGCRCEDAGEEDSHYECSWITSWGTDDNETCPSATGSYCIYQTEWETRIYESNKIGVSCDQQWGWNSTTYTSYFIGETCQAMYCADNGTLSNITLDEITGNAAMVAAVLDPNDNFFWGLQTCAGNFSQWYMTQNRFVCACDASNNETAFETLPMTMFNNDMGGIEELFEVCMMKTCTQDEWMTAPAMTGDFLGGGLGPINCPPTLTCPRRNDQEDEDDQEDEQEYCVSSDRCYASQGADFPEHWYSGAFVATNDTGCAEMDTHIQCLALTNESVPCATATYTANIFRYDCATRTASPTTLTRTDTLTCATNASNLDIATCPENDIFSRSIKYKWETLFGNRDLVETFGALECDMDSDEESFFDAIFFDEQCYSEHVMAFSQHIAEAFCGYMMIYGEALDASGKQLAQDSFEALMSQVGSHMSNGGCNFTVTCDVVGGSGFEAHISSEVVEMELELKAANMQKNGWKKKVQNKLAEQLHVKNTSVHVSENSEANNARRLNEETSTVTVSVNCANHECATGVETAIDQNAVTVGHVTTVRTVEINEQISSPTTSPTAAPTDVVTDDNQASGSVFHVAIVCSLAAAILG